MSKDNIKSERYQYFFFVFLNLLLIQHICIDIAERAVVFLKVFQWDQRTEQLTNSLIRHSPKINLLFIRKNPGKNFLRMTVNVQTVKKKLRPKPINKTQTFGGGPPPSKPTKQLTSLDIENYLTEPCVNIRLRPRKGFLKHPTKSSFSSKFLILSRGLPRRHSPAKIAARWRDRPSIKILTAHYDSQFGVSFYFCLYQEAQKRLQTCLNRAKT